MRKLHILSLGLAAVILSGCSVAGNKSLETSSTDLVIEEVEPVVLEDVGLGSLTRMNFPSDLLTVGEAVNWLLKPTEYELRLTCPGCSPDAYLITSDPVSPLAFPGQITTIRRALVLVAGSDSRLVVDETNKLVSFDFMEGQGQ